MKKLLIITLLFSGTFATRAQDNKKIDLSIMVGMAPMYAASSKLMHPFDNGPLSAGIQVYYNINRNIAAGIYGHGASAFSDNSETLFGNFGLAGKYIINPNSRFKFYFGLMLGKTFVSENIDDYYNDAYNVDELKDLYIYDENKFTVGVLAGLEIKIINAVSFNLQVSQQDIFGAFSKDFVIHITDANFYQLSNGYTYIAPGTAEAFTYVPFFVSGGLIFKFGKKKL